MFFQSSGNEIKLTNGNGSFDEGQNKAKIIQGLNPKLSSFIH